MAGATQTGSLGGLAPFPIRGASRRLLAVTLAVAALLHAPLMPSRLFDWLRIVMSFKQVEAGDLDGEVVVPIDLDLEPPAGGQPPQAAGAAAAGENAASVTEPAAPASKPRREPGDGGVDAALDAAPDAEVADAGADGDVPDGAADAGADAAPAAAVDAGVEDAGGADAGAVAKRPDGGAPKGSTPSLRNPLDAAGGVAKLASKDPNVQVLIASDRIRKHPLGAEFGKVLTTIPEWKTFFADTGIDPIRDFDHLLVAGPQFRDSRKVTAIVDYRPTEAQMRKAIDVLVDRSKPKGHWIDDAPVPAAVATADKGSRLFALVPDKKLLAILPPEAEPQLAELKKTKGFSKSSSAGIVISMVAPSRAFKNLPVTIPESMRWLRVAVVPMADGGAEVSLELMDESEDLAREHARDLEAQLEKLRKPDLGLFGGIASIELFEHVAFEAAGAVVRGKGHVTEHQIRRIMTYATEALSKPRGKPADKAGGK